MMRRMVRTLGWALIAAAGVLALLGALCWPPGGLFFALPYIFLIPAAALAVIGGIILLAIRPPPPGLRDSPE